MSGLGLARKGLSQIKINGVIFCRQPQQWDELVDIRYFREANILARAFHNGTILIVNHEAPSGKLTKFRAKKSRMMITVSKL